MLLSQLIHVALLASAASSAVVPWKSRSLNDTTTFPRVLQTTFSGPGCPRDSAQWLGLRGPQSNLPTYASSAFEVDNYANVSASNRQKYCDAHMELTNGRPGWQVAAAGLLARGHVKAANTTLIAALDTFWSQNYSYETLWQKNYTYGRAVDRDQAIFMPYPEDKIVWSPCIEADGYVGIFNINFRVFSNPGLNSDPAGYAHWGGADTMVKNQTGKYVTMSISRWIWRQCNSTEPRVR